jgi:hypothetical protein
MISVVICSINEQLFKQVSESIHQTIGIQFEIIQVKKASISAAYNEGASNAKYPFLCFVHEDVIFKSVDWGKQLIYFFEQNENAGIVGVAGSKYKSLTPSIWAQGLYKTDYYNILQFNPETKKSVLQQHHHHQDENIRYFEVKTLDGVFLFTTHKIWESNLFDEKIFNHFHGYDLDFCIQVGKTLKLYVTLEVLIEHFSTGTLNKDWVLASVELSKKWADILPLGDLPRGQSREIEWRNKKIFFYRMKILGYSYRAAFKQFILQGYVRNFSLSNNLNFMIELASKKLGVVKNQKKKAC